MVSTRRRRAVTALLISAVGALSLIVGLVVGSSFSTTKLVVNASVIKRPAPTYTVASNIPVLVYHEMNNGCQPTDKVCNNNKDPETVSTTQFTNEMTYLVNNGYHTITLAKYDDWLANSKMLLPSKPILLTADNGIGNLLTGAQPILHHDGFVMTAFLVTGFAEGAVGKCAPSTVVKGVKYDVQPGCGPDNKNWDLTWKQIHALDSSVYNFALEAGPSGHFVQTYDGTKCQMFDTCVIPGESHRQYEDRVEKELSTGLTDLHQELGSRFNSDGWVVPYSDLGYPQCTQSSCTPQECNGPHGWLITYAQHRFKAVFVEDAFRNGIQGERFRDDINGWMTESDFQQSLLSFTRAGDFNYYNAGKAS